jgi:hypothetical protein
LCLIGKGLKSKGHRLPIFRVGCPLSQSSNKIKVACRPCLSIYNNLTDVTYMPNRDTANRGLQSFQRIISLIVSSINYKSKSVSDATSFET